ncbi:MAG: DUF1428 domain-containing protein [Nanoarchaeota archaeon]|nr:DUF1428 domain-containing protein [Nanoarchaeota archaeon]
MKYVDGYVLVVPKKRVKEYEKMAKFASKIWKKHGALEYMECMGDDLNPNMYGMKMLGFPKMAKLKKGETVWFSFIVYKSKKHRDAVNKKVMKDPAMKDSPCDPKNMPFTMNRFSWGGFEARVVA